MKTLFCYLTATLFLVFPLSMKAQQVVASSANYFSGNNVLLSCSLGETVTGTLGNNEIILTQGFQQPYNFYLTQILNIPAGWSGISSFVEPIDMGIEGMFDPSIIPDFVFLASMSGFYYPFVGTNTLGNWNSLTGYKIKVNGDTEFSIKGHKVDQPEILLDEGWNLIPVLSACGVTTGEFYSALDSMMMIKEVGGINVYWPAYGIETLLVLEPGKAYFVRMSKSEIYTFPECSKNISTGSLQSKPVNKSPWNDPDYTAVSHLIAFSSELLAGSGIHEGEVMGVFTPGGFCAGFQTVNDLSSGFALVAFADDPTTEMKDGFSAGELMQFKVFRPADQQEMEMQVHFDPGLPGGGLFQPHGLSGAKTIKLLPSATCEPVLAELEVFPNPSHGSFTLRMAHWPDQFQILILDTRGHLVRTIPCENLSDGSAKQIDLQECTKGIYFLKLVNDKRIATRKLIIQ